jgi:hypothetical protein
MAEEIVHVFGCMNDGGSAVPAGSRVVLALGWVAKNRGLVKQFLDAQTTTVSLDGAASIDISDSYGEIEPRPDTGEFASGIRHDTGVTLAAGESLQVDGMMAVSHVVASGILDEDTHRPMLFRPTEPISFSCRITASA